MVGYESVDRAALPGHFGPKPFRPGTPQPKSFVFYTGAPRARLHSLVLILTLALVSKTKGLSASTTIKRMCYTLVTVLRTACEGKLKRMSGSTTIKETARKNN